MMNICHQMSIYSQQFGILLAMGLTMLAFSRIGKRHREETAYTALAGVSLMCLVNVFLSGPLSTVMDLVNCSGNAIIHVLWTSVVMAVIITILLMIIGKSLKVRAMEPKTLAICFFVGLALASFIGNAIENNCHSPKKIAFKK